MTSLAFKTLGGEGPDVVLIHGYGSDRLSWLATSPALMPLARVHALDLPGHGESDMTVGDGSAHALAARVTETLDTAGIKRTHLVAHSLGGAIGLLIAAEQPERVASVSLIAPLGLGRGVDERFVAALPELQDADQAIVLLRKLVVKPVLINKMTAQRAVDQLNREGARDAFKTIGRALVAGQQGFTDAALRVAEANIPRLTIWGGSDAINPLDEAKLQHFGGEMLVIPDTGHLPQIEAMKAVNTRLAEFISAQT